MTPALTPDQKAEVLRLKSEGRAVKDIAAMFKVSPATVKRVT
ncbi:helix-turn-helix domain-containing protein [Palleronia caenipelagi]|uniref:Helix-turn-helix domain-containing protein n=1 Tax=Palleronia caenipelagi TaxID=2489174 RepID=A0A547PJB8_9RHOB|nr:helix-turn-helix domain-containing protein [Palleronia caenipelagi]